MQTVQVSSSAPARGLLSHRWVAAVGQGLPGCSCTATAHPTGPTLLEELPPHLPAPSKGPPSHGRCGATSILACLRGTWPGCLDQRPAASLPTTGLAQAALATHRRRAHRRLPPPITTTAIPALLCPTAPSLPSSILCLLSIHLQLLTHCAPRSQPFLSTSNLCILHPPASASRRVRRCAYPARLSSAIHGRHLLPSCHHHRPRSPRRARRVRPFPARISPSLSHPREQKLSRV